MLNILPISISDLPFLSFAPSSLVPLLPSFFPHVPFSATATGGKWETSEVHRRKVFAYFMFKLLCNNFSSDCIIFRIIYFLQYDLKCIQHINIKHIFQWALKILCVFLNSIVVLEKKRLALNSHYTNSIRWLDMIW